MRDTSTSRAAAPSLRPGLWSLHPARSTVTFRHPKFWGLVTIKGIFTNVGGEGEVLPDGTASGTLTIAAASIDTRNAKRDEHLRSADFFDTARHGSIVFTASRVSPADDGTADVTGELTIIGVTRPLTFTARTSDTSADAVTLTADVIIDRADFGMTWDKLGVAKGAATITVVAHFTRQR